MQYQICSVFDEKADAFLTPFFMPQLAMAERIFKQMVNDPSHQFSKTPLDFTLFHLGTYDDGLAEFDTNSPRSIVNGNTLRDPDA